MKSIKEIEDKIKELKLERNVPSSEHDHGIYLEEKIYTLSDTLELFDRCMPRTHDLEEAVKCVELSVRYKIRDLRAQKEKISELSQAVPLIRAKIDMFKWVLK